MGSIKEIALKIKSFWVVGLMIVLCVLFFGLGRLSVQETDHSPLRIVAESQVAAVGAVAVVPESTSADSRAASGALQGGIELDPVSGHQTTEVIASKTGTRYYLPWCGALKRVKQENRVTFATADLARKAGYTPAANCKGTK